MDKIDTKCCICKNILRYNGEVVNASIIVYDATPFIISAIRDTKLKKTETKILLCRLF